ncbi:MAG TPA: FAD synthetase family protein [Anaerolineae bacterium]|jgi:riboflavin kinase/FMN adenylyltransferase
MQLYPSFNDIPHTSGSVVTVGTFDGVHLGHQALLRALVDDAHTRGLPSAVVTFYPHPRVVLGRAPASYLTLPEEKARQLQSLGVDILVQLAFTRETIQTTAAEFVHLMLEHLRMVSLWIGPDFALGNRRQGDAAYLRAQGIENGFAVNVLAPVNAGVESISSTRIRAALARGDMGDVQLCLGRPFCVSGIVADGVKIHVARQQAVPVAGTYGVQVCGERYQAAVYSTDGTDHVMELDRPIRCDQTVATSTVVEFNHG